MIDKQLCPVCQGERTVTQADFMGRPVEAPCGICGGTGEVSLREVIERGTQVIYVPGHVGTDDPEHPEVLHGFVTSVSDDHEWAWVRYWDKKRPTQLRTKTASAPTYFRDLRLVDTRDPVLVEKALRWIEQDNPELNAFCEVCGSPAEYDPDLILCPRCQEKRETEEVNDDEQV